MKGFKDTTKTVQGHYNNLPGYATGGIVVPYKAPNRTAVNAVRPVVPRPHVMPNLQKVSLPRTKMATGGKVGVLGKSDGGGGPYNPAGGNSLELNNRPYSKIEQDHPRVNARPGYKKGGIHIKPSHKGLFTKKMTGSKSGKLTGSLVQKGLHSSSGATRKQANFARMAKRHFQPLCEGGRATGFAKGGKVCDTDKMEGIANEAIATHVRSKPPQGHGVKPRGNLAFMGKPLFGK